MNEASEKKPYCRPSIETLGSRQVIEAMGVAHAGTYGAIENIGFGD
jgi:hypothetical protein